MTAIFEMVDRISDKLEAIATRGTSAIDGLDQLAQKTDNTFDKSITSVDNGTNSVENYANAITKAMGETDYWTNAVGNYDKSVMEAVYSTEELVNQGFKVTEALADEADIISQCDKATKQLSIAMEANEKIHDNCYNAIKKSAKITEELSQNEKINADTKNKLREATEEAEKAFRQLEETKAYSKEAIENYNAVIESGTKNIDDLEKAASQAATATDKMVEANKRATEATENLEKATSNATDEVENAEKKSESAIETLSNAISSAGILKAVKEIGEELLDSAHAAETAGMSYAKLSTIAGRDYMGMLKKQIKGVSLDSNSLISQQDLAEVSYNAISAGTAIEDAVSSAANASKLAIAGFTDTASALSILSTATNSYGEAAGTTEEISNSLIMTQNLGVTTVAELAANMGKAISTGASYNVSLGNVETSYVSLTKAGIGTAEATTYVSAMMSELGKEGSMVSDILTEQTGKSFGQLMSSGYTLADTLSILYDYANNDAEALMNLWGSQTAGVAASAIVNQGLENFNENLNLIENSAGATENAFAVMADTTGFAHQKMQQNAESAKIAIGENLLPAMDKLYSLGAKIYEGITKFAGEHPYIMKAIVATGVGIGTTAAAISGFVFVTKVAIPTLTSFGLALNTALGPIGWTALAITGLTAAGTAFVAMMNNAGDETAGMTAVTRKQYYELKNLSNEYDKAIERYGENSVKALRLKNEVDDLSKAFENSRQTVSEYEAEIDALTDSVYKLSDSFHDNINNINAGETGTLAIIQRYADLATQSELTKVQQKQLSAVTSELKQQFPELANMIDVATGSTDKYVETMKRACEQQAEQQRQDEAQKTYVDALKKRAELTDKLEKAQENYNLELAEYGMVWNEATQTYSNGYMSADSLWASWTTDLDIYGSKVDELNAAMEENEAVIADIEHGWEVTAETEKQAINALVGYDEAVSSALNSVKKDVESLCTAYDEAYESAKKSIDGQIGLFDNMKTETEISIADMQKAFDSQVEYLTTYSDNLKLAAQYGLDEGLISSLSDGSETSAGYINEIISNIQNLGVGTAEAEKFVNEFNEKFQDVETAKKGFATTIAKMETDFDGEMSKIETRLTESIDKMNMEDDAAMAAKKTMSSYIDTIVSETDNAVSAAEAAANAVANALNTSFEPAKPNGNKTVAVPGHAKGTTDAENVFIAGESGPELIVGAGGSTVFPHEETEKIINSLDEIYVAPSDTNNQQIDTKSDSNNSSTTKKVVLEIAGKGNIEISEGKTDKENVIKLLYEHIVPVLSDILQSEIYEEGDLSYDY